MIYVVVSRQEDQEVVETRRTDRKTAEQDTALIKDILRRAAWIVEAQ